MGPGENNEELWLPTVPAPRRHRDVNDWMRPTAIVVSAVALVLMFAGFVWSAAGNHGLPTLPGESGLPPLALFVDGRAQPGLALMSAGMALLGLLPVVRVGLAFAFYVFGRAGKDALVSLVLIALLVVSMLLE